MAAVVDIRARVSSLTKCSICLENFDQPKTLPCLHTFCLQCLKTLCRDVRPGQRMACPNCRKAFEVPRGGVEDLPLNFDMMALLEANRGVQRCDLHTQETIQYYCFDCHSDICAICLTLSHAEHRCENAATAADGLRCLMDADVNRVSTRFAEIEAEMRRLRERQRKYGAEMRKLETSIRKHGETVKKYVDEAVNRLVQRLQNVEATAAVEVQQSRDNLEMSLAALRSFKSYADEIRTRSRVSQTMKASGELRQKVDELLRWSVELTEYRAPVLTFTPTDFRQLVRSAGIEDDIVGKLSDVTTVTLQPAVQGMYQTARTTIYNNEPARQNYALRLRHKQPAGRTIRGVAYLDNEIYMLRLPANNEIEVYNVANYALRRHLVVPHLRDAVDLACCERARCLYVADDTRCIVRRVGLRGGLWEWRTGEKPSGISVTGSDGHVLVACRDDRLLKLFTGDGDLVRQIQLGVEVPKPCHAVELGRDSYIVCHGTHADQMNRVCIVDADGRVGASYGGDRGCDTGQLDFPRHVAVLADGTVAVADFNNARVVLLTSTLGFIRELSAETSGLSHLPYRLCVNNRQPALYVGALDRVTSAGQLFVFVP